MKNLFFYCFWALLLVVALDACKSAKKSLKRGEYDESVLLAVSKVKDNARSSSADILKEAYPLALQQHLDDLKRHETANDNLRWERMAESYTKLNQMYAAIQDCPACGRLVSARNFPREEQETRQKAAEARYEAGQSLLAQGGRDNARQAFMHFERAKEMIPSFRDINQKLDEAYEEASFKVVVEQVLVTSRAYQLSNEYFQNRINEFLQTNQRLNQFVRFYTPQEATADKVRPDHVVTLQFDDFAVGQTLIESKTEVVTSKDSVKVGETTVAGKKLPVYNKVTAKLSRNRKTVLSKGLLDMQIQDFGSKRVVYQEKFPGEYTWVCEWGSFNGDERALTADQKRMTNTRELMPPSPQQLFVEFSKPIYSRLTSKLKNFYDKY